VVVILHLDGNTNKKFRTYLGAVCPSKNLLCIRERWRAGRHRRTLSPTNTHVKTWRQAGNSQPIDSRHHPF
jgi:hypothetical protein